MDGKDTDMAKALHSENLNTPRGPYVHGLLLDNPKQLLFVAGQVGIRADGVTGKGIVEQTEIVWQNILEVLRLGGMGVTDIVKVTSFLTSPDYIKDYGAKRLEFLGDHRPTSTLLVVAGLASPDLIVEVEVVAAR
jgi:2-iminobutanoate/2-iminopropanoate deaminase